MKFLLDTNALSEARRARPNQGYMDWFNAQNPDDLFISVLSLGEIRFGVLCMEPGESREALEAWLVAAETAFANRVLTIDPRVMRVWPQVALNNRSARLQPGIVDELIAASAILHDLTLVTHNQRDFIASGCRVLSPWTPRNH